MTRRKIEREYETDFARNLNSWMEDNGHTQAVASALLEVPHRTLQNWLAETNAPELGTYLRVMQKIESNA